MASGAAIRGASKQALVPKNMDIATKTEDYTDVDPAWLETNSPSNRRVIEEAYKQYNIPDGASSMSNI